VLAPRGGTAALRKADPGVAEEQPHGRSLVPLGVLLELALEQFICGLGIGAEHGDGDASELALLEAAAGRHGEEVPCQRSIAFAGVLAVAQGLRELYEDRQRESLELFAVAGDKSGGGARVAEGLMYLREELEGAGVERISRDEDTDFLVGGMEWLSSSASLSLK